MKKITGGVSHQEKKLKINESFFGTFLKRTEIFNKGRTV